MMKRWWFALALVAGTSAMADVTGAEAKRIYNGLPGPARGPFCTGTCVPGEPCDPTCAWIKEDASVRCTKTEYKKSGKVEYSCANLDEES